MELSQRQRNTLKCGYSTYNTSTLLGTAVNRRKLLYCDGKTHTRLQEIFKSKMRDIFFSREIKRDIPVGEP